MSSEKKEPSKQPSGPAFVPDDTAEAVKAGRTKDDDQQIPPTKVFEKGQSTVVPQFIDDDDGESQHRRRFKDADETQKQPMVDTKLASSSNQTPSQPTFDDNEIGRRDVASTSTSAKVNASTSYGEQEHPDETPEPTGNEDVEAVCDSRSTELSSAGIPIDDGPSRVGAVAVDGPDAEDYPDDDFA